MALRIHKVPLSGLPADLHVPDELQNRFWFDAERKLLCYDGFMSKSTYDRLEALSRDRLYQSALEELFRISVPEDVANSSTRKVLSARLITIVGLVALCGLAMWILLAR